MAGTVWSWILYRPVAALRYAEGIRYQVSVSYNHVQSLYLSLIMIHGMPDI